MQIDVCMHGLLLTPYYCTCTPYFFVWYTSTVLYSLATRRKLDLESFHKNVSLAIFGSYLTYLVVVTDGRIYIRIHNRVCRGHAAVVVATSIWSVYVYVRTKASYATVLVFAGINGGQLFTK